ncbi:MAG: T9SS type A sorting domain-containing protein [Ferruginibacter sp.]|nr:T9SS type A sorting domain-containing protein [Ferruginibacter sp.]
MKKSLLTFISSFLFILASFGQDEEIFQASIKSGSTSNSVMIVLKSNTTFSGSIDNLLFTLQIPNTLSPQPTATIKSNPLETNVPVSTYATQVINEGGFYNYIFNSTQSGAAALNFTSSVEFNALEVEFTGGPVGLISDVRLAHLSDGGESGFAQFYIEIGGGNKTNYTNQFYGTSSNGGSFSSGSFATISNVTLPIKLINFNAAKSNNDAILSWTAANQTASNKRFDVERSIDGRTFIKIGNTDVRFNGNTTESYQYIDRNISSLRSGSLYYRIRQVDIYNKYSYSQVRNIALTEQKTASIFHNPASVSSTLNFELASAQKVSITVRDINGKVISTFQQDAAKGLNQAKINVNNLSKGRYNVTIADSDNNVQTLPLIKL